MLRLSLLALSTVAACQAPPFGEVLVQVDTDAPVPAFASRLRVDLYDAAGAWTDSRDFAAFHASDWPLSFSLATDDANGKKARVRLRAYPDGGTRDYLGERFPSWPAYAPPAVAATVDSLCANAPELPMYQSITLRRGGALVTERQSGPGCPPNAGGSVAVKVTIAQAGDYRFEVVRALPDGASGIPGGEATLFLRASCADAASQLACADDLDAATGNYLSRIVTTLQPGTYWLLTSTGAIDSPADVTLRWAPAGDWAGPPSMEMPPTVTPGQPRLVVDGADATPAEEPAPNLTIDRLIDVEVVFGRRATARVLLASECFGTAADLAGGATCVDRAGARAPVESASLVGGIDRGASSAVGTWAAAQPSACTKAPRARHKSAAGVDLFDEEVCIPGGAFRLGGRDDVGIGARDTFPEQYVVVEPFLLDKYEVTVGRYRQALADDFKPIAGEQALVENDADLFAPKDHTAGCTWSGDASGPAPGIDRETLPLTCIGWYQARALCRFFGGDLPTHAEWEYAAAAAGRPEKTRFPWGDEPPGCDRAVFGRAAGGACAIAGTGPSAVDAAPWATGDVTPLGVVGMGGSVGEWTGDAFRGYRDGCWWTKPLRGVGCADDEAPLRSMRGGDWTVPDVLTRAAGMLGQPPSYPTKTFGVRCARSGR